MFRISVLIYSVQKNTDITQLRTAVSAVSSSSASEGSTVHLRCLFRAGDGSSVPLSLLNGRRITWTIHNKHAWHNKTVAIESTVGSLSSVGVFRKAITSNMDLTVVLLPDASLMLPSVSQVQLDNAAVNCMLQHQVLRSGEGPVILQVTKQREYGRLRFLWGLPLLVCSDE